MSDAWDQTEGWLDEPSRRGAMLRRDAYRAMKQETPPYVVSAPEWAARWGETAPPVGTVLRWYDAGEVESRLAICVGADEWRVTPATGGLRTFPELARLIANAPCDVAVDWRTIPTVEARPAGDDAVKDWASQFLAPAAPESVNADAESGH